jgi:hypothetical protein
MTRIRGPAWISIAAACLIGACGHSQTYSMDGAWIRGGVSGDHFGIIVLLLREEDGRVTGTACRTSSGHLIFRDVPVTGRYPRLTFESGAGRYAGGVISDEFINGFFQYPGGSQEWTFRRTSPSDYDACQSARP